VIVSPTSARDVERASQIADMNRASSLATANPNSGPGNTTYVPLPGQNPRGNEDPGSQT
jgi:hypothetical protein